MSGVKDPGVNTVHRTEGCPARPVHGAFQHSMARRCFNHDYRAPFFYMVTMTTHQRRPWFGVCENSACTPLTRETCLALNSACAHLAEAPTTEVTP